MAYMDFKSAYSRSIFGFFWEPFTTILYVLGLSVLWSNLLPASLGEEIVRISLTFIAWRFISGVFIRASQEFTVYGQYYIANPPDEYQVPFFVILNYSLRLLINLPIFILFYFIFAEYYFNPLYFLLFIMSIISLGLFCNLACYISAISEDISHLLITILGMALLVTPVFWDTIHLGDKWFYVLINPFAVSILDIQFSFIKPDIAYNFNLMLLANTFWFLLAVISSYFSRYLKPFALLRLK